MIQEKLQKVQEVKYMLRDAKKDITDSVQVIVRVIKKKQRDVFLRNKSAHYSKDARRWSRSHTPNDRLHDLLIATREQSARVQQPVLAERREDSSTLRTSSTKEWRSLPIRS